MTVPCGPRVCGCGIRSTSLAVTGSGHPGDPYNIEGIGESVMTNAARLALAGAELWDGRFVTTTDAPRRRWEYVSGTGWKCRFQELTDYTPLLTGFSAGAGSSLGHLWRDGQSVHYQGTVILGAGFSFSAQPELSLPVDMVAGEFGSNNRFIGNAWMYDASTGFVWNATATIDNVVGLFSFYTAAAGQTFAINATTPFTWAASDQLAWTLHYPGAD